MTSITLRATPTAWCVWWGWGGAGGGSGLTVVIPGNDLAILHPVYLEGKRPFLSFSNISAEPTSLGAGECQIGKVEVGGVGVQNSGALEQESEYVTVRA